MAHTAQERYAKLVDAKLRNTLVTKDNLILTTVTRVTRRRAR